MKRKLVAIAGVAALVGGVGAASASAAPGNGNSCHAFVLQIAKAEAGQTSAAATAASFGLTVQQGQELISQICGQS